MRGQEAARETAPEVLPGEFDADAALDMMSEYITKIYLPFRGAPGYGTERAIFCEPPHVPHRENDAEHTWHVETSAELLWDNRAELGLRFPQGFDINKALAFLRWHDIVEVKAPDINATTTNRQLIEAKDDKEHRAIQEMVEELPFLRKAAQRWLTYERKDTYEARWVSDLEKNVATLVIFLDGGNKWHDWEGDMCTRERMCDIYRAKMKTEFGHALMDALERRFDVHPERFPDVEYAQGSLF